MGAKLWVAISSRLGVIQLATAGASGILNELRIEIELIHGGSNIGRPNTKSLEGTWHIRNPRVARSGKIQTCRRDDDGKRNKKEVTSRSGKTRDHVKDDCREQSNQ